MPITADIRPALPPDTPTATATGSETWDITSESDPRLKWFHADLASIRAAINRFAPAAGGGRINTVGPATGPCTLIDANLNIIGHWPGGGTLTVEATPDTAAPHVAVSADPQLLAFQRFHNALSEPQKFKGHVALQRTETVEHSWSKQTTIGSSLTVEVGIEAEGISAKTSATISESETAGKGGSESQTVSKDQVTEIDVLLDPGEWGMAAFGAWAGSLQVSIPVTASLSGVMVLDLKAHNWWSLYNPDAAAHQHVTRVAIHVDQINRWALPPPAPGASMVALTTSAHDTLTIDRGWYTDTLAEALPLPDDSDDSARAVMATSLKQATPGRD